MSSYSYILPGDLLLGSEEIHENTLSQYSQYPRGDSNQAS
jgi:hypothetical protein